MRETTQWPLFSLYCVSIRYLSNFWYQCNLQKQNTSLQLVWSMRMNDSGTILSMSVSRARKWPLISSNCILLHARSLHTSSLLAGSFSMQSVRAKMRAKNTLFEGFLYCNASFVYLEAWPLRGQVWFSLFQIFKLICPTITKVCFSVNMGSYLRWGRGECQLTSPEPG